MISMTLPIFITRPGLIETLLMTPPLPPLPSRLRSTLAPPQHALGYATRLLFRPNGREGEVVLPHSVLQPAPMPEGEC